jgi:hypothetical protein
LFLKKTVTPVVPATTTESPTTHWAANVNTLSEQELLQDLSKYLNPSIQ